MQSISSEEVAAAVRSTKSGKTAVSDRFTSELFRAGDADRTVILATLFSSVWTSLSIPSRRVTHHYSQGQSQIAALRKDTKSSLPARPVARIVKTRRQTGRAPPPFPPLPPSPLPLEVGPLNPARGSGERCNLIRSWQGTRAPLKYATVL